MLIAMLVLAVWLSTVGPKLTPPQVVEPKAPAVTSWAGSSSDCTPTPSISAV